MASITLNRNEVRVSRAVASAEAWNAYMAQREIENAAEAASKAAGYEGAAEVARERAERKADRLLRAYQRTVDHIRVD